MGENALDDPNPINQDPIVKPTRRLQTSAVEPQRGSFTYCEWRQTQRGKEAAASAAAPERTPEHPMPAPDPTPRAKPKRRRRSVLGIVIFIVIAVLVASTFASVGKDLFESIFDTDAGTDAGSTSYQVSSGSANSEVPYANEEEAYAAGLLSDRLELFKNADDSAVEQLAGSLDASFAESTEVSLADCGVDPHELARTLLEGFDYSISYVDAYEDEDTGYVSANVDCRLWYQAIASTASKVESLEEDPTPAEVGALLMESAEETPIERDQYVSVDIVRVDGTWMIDEESWAEELKWLFWL